MSARKNKDLFEAVFFFGKKSITKEMRYSEFEAILDGVVAASELANREVQAAYIRINNALKIHSIVTFNIEFNERGFADEDWNIPLRHLAEQAGPGPDLGAGPIRLACRSQCSVSWYQRELWEPSQDGVNHFVLLRDAVKRNKLGLIVDDVDDDVPLLAVEPPVLESAVVEPEVPVISERVDFQSLKTENDTRLKAQLAAQAEQFQKQVDLLVLRQKQNINNLEERFKDEIDQVKRAMRNEAQSYRHQSQELEQQANQRKVLLEKLQARNTRLERDQVQLQDKAETLQSQYEELKSEYLDLLRQQRNADEEETAKVVELKEQLTEQLVEMDGLRDEITEQKALVAELTSKLEGYQHESERVSAGSTEEIQKLKSLLGNKQDEVAAFKATVISLQADVAKLSTQLSSANAEASRATNELIALESSNRSMRERVKQSEFDLQASEQKVIELTNELENLRLELTEAEGNSIDTSAFFEKMEQLELVFVAYHPGAGHISLPARQLEDYLEKPLSFAAQKCSVTLEQYKNWLAHYDSPECGECSVPVKRVDIPSEFQTGVSDRCAKHRVALTNVSNFRKSS